jgi:hypothetical protein
MDAGANRVGINPEDRPCLIGRHPDEVDEDESFALGPVETAQHPDDFGAVDRGWSEVVLGLTLRYGPASSSGGPAQRVPLDVHRRAIQIGTWCVHRRDPSPSLQDPDERLVSDVLSLDAATGYEQQVAEERYMLAAVERVEVIATQGDALGDGSSSTHASR